MPVVDLLTGSGFGSLLAARYAAESGDARVKAVIAVAPSVDGLMSSKGVIEVVEPESDEAEDKTAREAAIVAFEQALGVTISPETRQLRRLLYCGEWIESHFLHIYLLHLPDFLGYPSAIAMAADKRHPFLPEVSTMAEQGYKDFVLGNWVGIVMPTGTPKPIIDKIKLEFDMAKCIKNQYWLPNIWCDTFNILRSDIVQPPQAINTTDSNNRVVT